MFEVTLLPSIIIQVLYTCMYGCSTWIHYLQHARVQGTSGRHRGCRDGGRNVSVAVEHFEELVASKCEDRMHVFQREFMVSL